MDGPAGLTIRAVRAEDAEAIAELQALPGYRWGTLRPPFPSAAKVRAWLAALPPGDLALVVEAEGRVVGNGSLHRFEGRRAHAANFGMGVHDAFRGRGVGRALLASLLDAADNWLDIRRLELSVFADNAPAIRLYERAGFAVEGRFRAFAFRDGAYVDALSIARLRGL